MSMVHHAGMELNLRGSAQIHRTLIFFYKTIKDQATVANPGGKIKITFPIKPDELYLSVTNTNEESEELNKPDQYSFNLPNKPGYYRYNLSAVWDENNSVGYYFGVWIEEP